MRVLGWGLLAFGETGKICMCICSGGLYIKDKKNGETFASRRGENELAVYDKYINYQMYNDVVARGSSTGALIRDIKFHPRPLLRYWHKLARYQIACMLLPFVDVESSSTRFISSSESSSQVFFLPDLFPIRSVSVAFKFSA
jgi:hypothetical protein